MAMPLGSRARDAASRQIVNNLLQVVPSKTEEDHSSGVSASENASRLIAGGLDVITKLK